ncbi:MAG: hypothetical protein KGI54_09605 [Pseudomonadota bacterium]|nr:hypothetical protein [Pseudomonadota bacterium]
MKVEILKHELNHQSASTKPSPVIGHMHLLINEKIKIWVSVLKAQKTAHLYIRGVNTNVRGEWVPAFELVDKDIYKELSQQLAEDLKRIFDAPPKSNHYESPYASPMESW